MGIILLPSCFAGLAMDVTCSPLIDAYKPCPRYIIFPLPQGLTNNMEFLTEEKLTKAFKSNMPFKIA